ncbi:MAG: hypothetical protein ACRDJS_01825 [Actinomycetota bacterium]
MLADISGAQRKILVATVRPAKTAHGSSGIALRRGRTLPFVIYRQWSAPAGYYAEQWFLVVPDTKEVVHEGPVRRETLIWGLQAVTELTDTVRESIRLEPGTYKLVFALGGLLGGELEVQVFEAPAEEAA